MKKQHIIASLLAGILCLACNHAPKEDRATEEERIFQTKTAPQGGIREMTDLTMDGNVEIKGKTYHYKISRTSNHQLPIVKDNQENRYYDNEINLLITQEGGKQIVDKKFIKKDFANNLPDAKFLTIAVLDGMGFNEIQNDRFTFTVSMCCPQTDFCQMLDLEFDTNGNMSISETSGYDGEIPFEEVTE